MFNYGPLSYQHARPDGHPRCAPKSSTRPCLYSDMAAIRNIRNSLRRIPKLRLAPLIFKPNKPLITRSVPISS